MERRRLLAAGRLLSDPLVIPLAQPLPPRSVGMTMDLNEHNIVDHLPSSSSSRTFSSARAINFLI